MKLYRITFTDPEQGFLVQWKRNLKEIDRLVLRWATQYPMRQQITQDYVEIPTEKSAFINWLNENACRRPKQ